MTEDSGAQDAVAPAATVAPPPPPPAPMTAGGLLREAREAAGLHIAALAVSMKVPVAKLEALEADRFDLLPDAVFARALASGVCRQLKIDPRPVLDKLPQSAKPLLKDNERGIDAPFRSPSDGPGPGVLDKLSWPVVAVGALVLGMVGIYFYPHARTEPVASSAVQDPVMPPDRAGQAQVVQSPDAPPTGTVVETPTAQPLTAAPAVVRTPTVANAPGPTVANAPAPAAPSLPAPAMVQPTPQPQAITPQALPGGKPTQAASAVQPRASQAVAAASAPAKPASAAVALAKPASAAVPLAKPASAVVAPAKPASQPANATAVAPAASQPVAFAGSSGMLVLKAKVPSWVSVVDARGVSVINKVLAAGEVAAASGAAPLRVTVGKADGTEVLVRGKAFDLQPVARENVARFEVK